MKNKEIKQFSEDMLNWDIEMGTHFTKNIPFIQDLYCLKNMTHLFANDNEDKMRTMVSMLASAYYDDDDYYDAMTFIDCFAFAYIMKKADIETAINWENWEEATDSIAYLCKLPFAPKDWCFETMYKVIKMSLAEKGDC